MSVNPNDPLGVAGWANAGVSAMGSWRPFTTGPANTGSMNSTDGPANTGSMNNTGGEQMYQTQGAPDYGTYNWDAVMRALAAQNQFNQGIQQGGLDNQGRQINNTNAYQQGLLRQAQAQLAQAAQQFEQTYGLQVGSLTGMFGGQPTLANLGQQAQYTGMYGGTPTLQAINQGQQFGLQQGQLQGWYNGAPTLAGLQNQQQQALNWAGLTGQTPGGGPTLAAQLGLGQLGIQQGQLGLAQAGVTGTYGGSPTQQAQQQAYNQWLASQQLGQAGATLTGQYNGAPTQQAQQQAYNQWLASQQLGQAGGALVGEYNGQQTLAARQLAQQNEQARGQLGLQTLQLGASLGGPSDWLNYENAASGARQNPLLASGVASWADMTSGRPTGTGGWAGDYQPTPRSIGTLGTDFGGPVGGGNPGIAPPGAVDMVQGPNGTWVPGPAAGGGFSDPLNGPGYGGGGQPSPFPNVDPRTGGSTSPGGAMFSGVGGGSALPAGGAASMGGAGGQDDMARGWAAQHGQGAMPAPGRAAGLDPTSTYMAQVGQKTNQWAPGFWGNLNPDQQEMYKGAWKNSGQSPATVLANASRNGIGQGFSRAA